MHITFTDPGLHLKTITLESPDHFFEVVCKEGGEYTTAELRVDGVRKSAWRPLGGEWVEGSFVASVREACRQQGFELPEGYSLRQLRDQIDYEGLTMAKLAEKLKLEVQDHGE